MNAVFTLTILESIAIGAPTPAPVEIVVLPPKKMTASARVVVGVSPDMSIPLAIQILAVYLTENGVSKVSIGHRSCGVAYNELKNVLRDVIESERQLSRLQHAPPLESSPAAPQFKFSHGLTIKPQRAP